MVTVMLEIKEIEMVNSESSNALLSPLIAQFHADVTRVLCE